MAVVAVSAMYAAQMAMMTQGYYEPDPNAYVMSGKQLVQHHTLRFDGRDLLRFHDHMWVEPRPNEVYAKYPPGYPLILGVAWRLGGDRAIFWVSPFFGAIGLLAAYFLMRKMAGPWISLVGTACFVINPMLALYNGYILSHATSFGVVTVGMWLLWTWWERGGWGRALAAGVVLGYAPLVRYTDALVLLPMAAVVLLRLAGVYPHGGQDLARRPLAGARRRIAVLLDGGAMGAGALACLVPLMLHHRHAFGELWRTGYDLTGEQTAFQWALLAKGFPVLIHHLNDLALFMIFPLAVLGTGLLCVRRRWAESVVLGLWVVPTVLVYASYYWAPPNYGFIYVRFQMSTLAAYFMAFAFLLDQVLEGRRAAVRVAIPAAWFVLVALVVGGETTKQIREHRQAWPLEKAARETTRLLPPDAVVFSEGPMNDYLQTIQNFTVYKLDYFRPDYSPRMLQRGWAEPMRQKARAEKIAAFLGTDHDALQELKRETIRKQLAAGKTVAFLVGQASGGHHVNSLGKMFKVEKLSAWTCPFNWPSWSPTKPTWELYRVTIAEATGPSSP